MREVKGDAWKLLKSGEYDVLCITTNGTIKSNGAGVMGAGIAKVARDSIFGIDRRLGNSLKEHGNVPVILAKSKAGLFITSFPVKHEWHDKADIKLIKQSAVRFMDLADKFGFQNILLPRPGCGNGKLKWEEVRPVLDNILDERFVIVTY